MLLVPLQNQHQCVQASYIFPQAFVKCYPCQALHLSHPFRFCPQIPSVKQTQHPQLSQFQEQIQTASIAEHIQFPTCWATN